MKRLSCQNLNFAGDRLIRDAEREATGIRSENYFLYGHSEGTQFVHRFLFVVPQARSAQAVAPNAGWWTLPDREIDAPYGLRNSVVVSTAMKIVLQRPPRRAPGRTQIIPICATPPEAIDPVLIAFDAGSRFSRWRNPGLQHLVSPMAIISQSTESTS